MAPTVPGIRAGRPVVVQLRQLSWATGGLDPGHMETTVPSPTTTSRSVGTVGNGGSEAARPPRIRRRRAQDITQPLLASGMGLLAWVPLYPLPALPAVPYWAALPKVLPLVMLPNSQSQAMCPVWTWVQYG